MQTSLAYAQSEIGLTPAAQPPLGLKSFEVAQAPDVAGSISGRGTQDAQSEVEARESNAEAETAERAGFGWRLPPIRWGGSMTTEIRLQQLSEQRARLQQVENAVLRAGSYIWQPWFAQVSGSLGLLTSREHGGESAGTTPGAAARSSSNAVTANATLAVFPVSRFPFNAYFDRSDSRAGGELTQSDITSTRYGARQSYRPVEGLSNYSASFDRSTLMSPAFGRDTVNALAVNMNSSIGAHLVDFAGNRTSNTRSNTGESTNLTRLFARHRFQSDAGLAVESLASATGSDFHLISAGVPSDNRARFLQASTLATWRPDEDSPLYVTGGGRLFQAVTQANGAEADAYTLSGNLAASYALSPNMSVAGNAVVTQAVAGATSDSLTAQNASVTYIAEPHNLRGFLYTWSAGANAGNLSSSLSGSKQNLGGQVGHTVTRGYALDESSLVTVSLGQNLNSAFDTVTASSRTLGHNANLTWRRVPRASTTTFVSLSTADARTSGHNQNQFQLLNAQATGQIQFSRSASAAADLTLQAVRQSTPLSPATGFNYSSSGRLAYQHLRIFDIPRLRYFALYSINDSQFTTRLQGDVQARREQVTQSFEQRLEYNIGRVELRLTARVAVIDGKRNALVYFRVARQFGDF